MRNFFTIFTNEKVEIKSHSFISFKLAGLIFTYCNFSGGQSYIYQVIKHAYALGHKMSFVYFSLPILTQKSTL